MQIPLMLLQLKGPEIECKHNVWFFSSPCYKNLWPTAESLIPFPCSFHTSWLQNIRFVLQVMKNSSFSFLFWRGLILQVSQGSLAPATGQHFRRGSVLRWPSAQCMHWLCSPMWLAPVSGQDVCFILRQTKPFEKHKAKWGLKSQLCQYTHGMWQYFVAHLVYYREERVAWELPRAGCQQHWMFSSEILLQCSNTNPAWLCRTALGRTAVFCCKLGQEVKSHLWSLVPLSWHDTAASETLIALSGSSCDLLGCNWCLKF